MIDDRLVFPHTVLIALYLRGCPGVTPCPARRWPSVLSLVRSCEGSFTDASESLRESGYWQEATLLLDRRRREWAEFQVHNAITPLSAFYPSGWLRILGDSAPPALWASWSSPKVKQVHFNGAKPYLGVVGSRQVSPDVWHFANETGAELARLGFNLVSGGAIGCDRAAASGFRKCSYSGAAHTLTLLPCGLDHATVADGLYVSLCAPADPFSSAAAMERNALIFAASQATVVVQARFKEGGTWHGATGALRRRLTNVIVREDATSAAHRALVGLGAAPLANPQELADTLRLVPDRVRFQRDLFSLG